MKSNILKPTIDQLLFQSGQSSVLLKREDEEIWAQGKLVAYFDDISGIAVKEHLPIAMEDPQLDTSPYCLELSLNDRQKIVLAEALEDREARYFVKTLFDFLGIEY